MMKDSNNSMENLRQLILKFAEDDSNVPPLTPAVEAHIAGWLTKFFSEYETPDHPPYSAMIERAIRELNEKGGSCLETISEFLLQEYSKLPWGHLLLLKHHLDKLCESGDIVVSRCKKYRLRPVNSSSNFCKSQAPSETRWKQGQECRENSGVSVKESNAWAVVDRYGANGRQKTCGISDVFVADRSQREISEEFNKRHYQNPSEEEPTKRQRGRPPQHWRDRLY